MYKRISIFLLSLLLFATPAAASDLQQEKQKYESQLQEIEKQISETDDREKLIPLVQQENEVAAYVRAYDKAIGETVTTITPQMYLIETHSELKYINIYKAAAEVYKIDWSLLAAVHDVETTFSTHPTMYSSAGAQGHMQFMPATWDYYGVDADGDGKADPYSLTDAIFSAANYLAASGAATGNIEQALWAYNHDTEYGLMVIEKAKRYKAAY